MAKRNLQFLCNPHQNSDNIILHGTRKDSRETCMETQTFLLSQSSAKQNINPAGLSTIIYRVTGTKQHDVCTKRYRHML